MLTALRRIAGISVLRACLATGLLSAGVVSVWASIPVTCVFHAANCTLILVDCQACVFGEYGQYGEGCTGPQILLCS